MTPMTTSDEKHLAYELRLRKAFFDRLAFAKASAEIEGRPMNNADIARALHASESTIGQWFNPEVMAMPEGIKLIQLPDILGCSFEWLMAARGDRAPVDASERDQYLAGVRETIARVERFASDLRQSLDGRRAKKRGATAAADVRRELERRKTQPPRNSGGHRK